MTRWKKRFGEDGGGDEGGLGLTGLYCERCHKELDRGELFGVGNSGLALCAECADGVWDELEPEEKLECLGYEVDG